MGPDEDRTVELWRAFMPRRREIENTINADLYHVHVYRDQSTDVERWAALEVSDDTVVPQGMKRFSLSGGLYAVFTHRGPATSFANTFQFIFSEWMPASQYEMDSRPRFEVLGQKYKNNAPDSEEEIWIPIKMKA